MTQLTKLTYGTKTNPIAVTDRTKQATAEDFNEIKSVVNNCADGINWIKSDEVALETGLNHVDFLAPYPPGIPFSIVVHNCYNSDGYLIAHYISNKTVSGFDITVSQASTLTYLSVVKR